VKKNIDEEQEQQIKRSREELTVAARREVRRIEAAAREREFAATEK